MVINAIKNLLRNFFWVSVLCLAVDAQANSTGFSENHNSKYRFKGVAYENIDLIGGLWAIEQDAQGFMWFGGENGLARYDGYDVKIYRNTKGQLNSLSSSYIRDLLLDSNGQLWIATAFGLNQYIPETDNFIHYIHDSNDPSSISGNDIRSLEEDDSGFLWIATGASGLNRFDKKQQRFQAFVNDSLNPDSLASNQLYDLEIDSSGDLWIGTMANGLDKLVLTPALSTHPDRFVHYQHNHDDPNSISSNDIRSIYQDRHGVLWVGTVNGLNRLDKSGSHFLKFFNDWSDLTSLSSNFVQDMAEDGSGNLWFATSGRGINKLDAVNNRFERYVHSPEDSSSLLNNNVRTLYSAADGNFWLGHFAAGVSMLDYYASAFKNYYHNPFYSQSLNSNEITSIVENEDGNLWVGTVAGVNFLDRTSNMVTRYDHDPKSKNSISEGGVLDLLLDSKKRLWVGLWNSSLNRIDTQTGKVKKYSSNPKNNNTVASTSVWALLEDSQARIWVGNHVGGLQLYDEERDSFVVVSTDDNEGVDSSCNSVFSIFEDSRQNLWVGCSSGLYLLPKGESQFEHFVHEESNESSISANHIWMINEDVQGFVWVGTQGGGVNRYDPLKKTFTAFRAGDGLADDLVTGMLQDDKGYIWFITGRGLSRLDPKLGNFKNYDKRYGLPGNVFNRSAYVKTKFNEFVIGSKDGLSIFNPKFLPQNQHVPKVHITDFELFNIVQGIGTKDSPLQQSILTSDHLVLKPGMSSFSLQFSALNYQVSSENKYAYRLEGFDSGWNYVGKRRRAYYTNLDPGEYRFRVKAANNEGLWNESGDYIDITILPPWWFTWWAYLLYGFSVTTFFFLLVQVFWQRKLADNERIISEKLRAFDKVKDSFLANTSHEIRTPLNGIIGLSESLRDGVAGKLPVEAEHYLDMIIVSGKRLANLVNDILDFSKLRESKISLKKMPVDLFTISEVVLSLFAPMVKGRPIELKNKIDKNIPLLLADENRLQQILYNLIGNAVKFTDKGSITLSTSISDKMIWIAVEDTGVGISEDKYEIVFHSYQQLDNDACFGDLGTGLGLTVTKQLVELHGGSIELKSSLGKGSCFRFSLPLPSTDGKPLVKPLSSYSGKKATFERDTRVFSAYSTTDNEINSKPMESPKKNAHILVVDDEPVNRLVLEGFLKVKEYRITESSNGYDALAALAEHPDIALVLLDVMMPRLSGLDTCKIIREKYTQNELPVIFLTGRNQRADLEAGYNVGGNDFLTKPVTKEELLSRVETHLLLADKMRYFE